MKKFISNVLTVCFICYMVLLVYFLFFSEEYGRTASYTSYRINLHLFAEIRRYFAYRDTIGFAYFFINMFGNVIAFMPFGFLLPVMYREQRKGVVYSGHYFRSFLFVTCMGFMVSLLVETVQLITKVGCFDVDDLFEYGRGYARISVLLYFKENDRTHGKKVRRYQYADPLWKKKKDPVYG